MLVTKVRLVAQIAMQTWRSAQQEQIKANTCAKNYINAFYFVDCLLEKLDYDASSAVQRSNRNTSRTLSTLNIGTLANGNLVMHDVTVQC